MALTKAQLLEAAKSAAPPQETVHVPELGGDVILRGMTGTQRDAWERSLIVQRGKRTTVNTDNVRARLVTRCLVDESGNRLLEDSDADVLGSIRVDVLNRLYEVAQRLSGVRDEDVEELKNGSGSEGGSGSPSN